MARQVDTNAIKTARLNCLVMSTRNSATADCYWKSVDEQRKIDSFVSRLSRSYPRCATVISLAPSLHSSTSLRMTKAKCNSASSDLERGYRAIHSRAEMSHRHCSRQTDRADERSEQGGLSYAGSRIPGPFRFLSGTPNHSTARAKVRGLIASRLAR